MPNRKEVPPPAFDAAGDPPPPSSDLASEMMRTHPYFTVTLDAGAFMRLWRIVEAQAQNHVNNAARAELLPHHTDVMTRTVESFRTAYAGKAQALNTAKPKRVLKKR